MISYRITPLNSHQHLLQVSLYFNNKNNNISEIYLPNWTAGSYMIRDFCRHIVSITAKCDEKTVLLQQTHKNRWQTPPIAGKWCVEYVVYAFDLSVRGAFFDDERLFFDGAAVLMGVAGRENESCKISFKLPKQVESIMALSQIAAHTFIADNYPALLDAPFVSGSLYTLSFSICGIPHKIVLSGDANEFEYLDHNRLTQDIAKICTQYIELFGKAPFEQYTFILHITDNEYGGLEHRSSSSLIASRRCLPNIRYQNNRDDYVVLLGLFSHEYFHAWNIKSIKPAVFEHYDLQQEVYTSQLWAYEGITSYYDDLMLVRSEVISHNEYLMLLLKNIDKVYQYSGRLLQSVAQSSFEAWSKYYKQNENSPNAITSYYQKGALVALCLDLTIRHATNNQHSLDDVMRLLFQRYLDGHGLTQDNDWQTVAEKVSGCLLNDFFQRYIYGTEDLPLVDLLHHVGLSLRFQAGCRITLSDKLPPKEYHFNFGAKLDDVAGGKVIRFIAHNSLAEQAGLAVGDTIMAINHCHVTEWNRVWQQIGINEEISIHLSAMPSNENRESQ